MKRWMERARLAELAGRQSVRAGFAALFVAFHLIMFWRAGAYRLDLPFNSAPTEAPFFSDIHAPATRGYPRQPHHWSRLIVSRWDAQHYIGTATRGLTACPTTKDASDGDFLDCGLGWLPAYGMTGRVFTALTGLAADWALMWISMLALFSINLLLTGPLLAKRLGTLEAYAAVVALNLFPSAFYLVAPYAESLTLLGALLAWWALSKERWLLASVLVGAATALKTQAVTFALGVGCSLLWLAWTRRKAGDRRWWLPLLGGPLCVWGQVATMLGLQIETGDWRAFLRARHAFGDAQHWHRLVEVTNYTQGIHSQHHDMVTLFGVVAILLLTAKTVLKALPRPEAIYLAVASVATLPIAIVAPLHWWGMNRYLLACPLVFLGAGVLARRARTCAILVPWLVLCVVMYWNVELCSYISHGNKTVCPCLGKTEFTMPFQS